MDAHPGIVVGMVPVRMDPIRLTAPAGEVDEGSVDHAIAGALEALIMASSTAIAYIGVGRVITTVVVDVTRLAPEGLDEALIEAPASKVKVRHRSVHAEHRSSFLGNTRRAMALTGAVVGN